MALGPIFQEIPLTPTQMQTVAEMEAVVDHFLEHEADRRTDLQIFIPLPRVLDPEEAAVLVHRYRLAGWEAASYSTLEGPELYLQHTEVSEPHVVHDSGAECAGMG